MQVYGWKTKLQRRPAFVIIRAHLENDLKRKTNTLFGKCLTKKRQLVSWFDSSIKWIIWAIFTVTGLPLVSSHLEIVNYGKVLSLEFIKDRLRKDGLMYPDSFPVPSTDVSRQLKRVGTELINCYPGLFKDVFKQLNITITTKTSLEGILIPILNELFRFGISWPKMLAMFCIAASLSQECLRHGNGVAINEIVQVLTQFIDKKLAKWIAQHGGWVDFHRHFRNSHQNDVICIVLVLVCVFTLFLLYLY
ncbi:bcl-2-related ovarian killer protein homolog B-like [Antedon mediterranea]|uniref:bcl-2-related ovarian killer protein homolog B-like n=1 Tax=Antedon mediterranea TaxID=105859 RepID=UPI003AF83707